MSGDLSKLSAKINVHGKNNGYTAKVKILFLSFASSFLLLTVLAPMCQSMNSIKNLSGYVGIYDNQNITSVLSFPWNYIYAFGDMWCHQKTERSLFIGGNQMPVCARCFGIFFGVPLGLCTTVFIKTRVDKNIHKRILMTLIGYVPLAVDGMGQLVGLWHSTNLTRLLTGTLAGIAFGFILGITIDIVCAILARTHQFYHPGY